MYGSDSTTSCMQQLLRRLASIDASHKAQSMALEVDVSGLPFSYIFSNKAESI